jgi:cyclopropane fatty-acyl-phospholipid synthase-like methyltransferase
LRRNGSDRFKDLVFEDFKKLALDDSLSPCEKIGFPDSYRKGKEERIFQDITHKLCNLTKKSKTVLDIGPGCSGLAFMMIELCRKNGHTLILVDSEEMLNHLPDEPFIVKVPGMYPVQSSWLFEKYAGRVDVILTYSVIHYVFAESNPFHFVDKSLELLADGGQMLIGDIPNISKRKRFFSSPDGIRFHQAFTGTNEVPTVQFKVVETGKIDDAIVLGLTMRCRNAGFDTYVLPQANGLPMANRREDILIIKP